MLILGSYRLDLGTGCDYISRFGKKHGAMKASPEQYLQSFGEGHSLTDDEIVKAELYLVQVLKSGSECTTLEISGAVSSKETIHHLIYHQHHTLQLWVIFQGGTS